MVVSPTIAQVKDDGSSSQDLDGCISCHCPGVIDQAARIWMVVSPAIAQVKGDKLSSQDLDGCISCHCPG